MTELLELEDLTPEEPEEMEIKMGSINHSLVQTRLIRTLPNNDRYIIATELSLDVSSPERQQILKKYKVRADRELIPDLCLFNTGDIDYLEPDEDEGDILRTEKVPRLCIEIVSPSQSSTQILRKFRAYFALGVKSCWYVDPNLKLIMVYSGNLKNVSTFLKDEEEVTDHQMNIHFTLNQVFFKQALAVD